MTAMAAPDDERDSVADSDEMVLRSRLDGPINDLARLRASLLFAELSMLSYLPESDAVGVAGQVGLHESDYIERDGAQAYVFENDVDRIVVCRGTEPGEWNDIKADANAFTAVAETVGRVHRGFKREVDDLWPLLEEHLTEPDDRDLWFTGHSLGGAMAQIAAGRCRLSTIPAIPEAVYTYGSPRVGTRTYIDHAGVEHVRWVNNNDLVTKVPPVWLRYRHRGNRMYIDHGGGVHDRIPRRTRIRDQWHGFRKGLKQRKLDHFSDHAIVAYVDHLTAAVHRGG